MRACRPLNVVTFGAEFQGEIAADTAFFCEACAALTTGDNGAYTGGGGPTPGRSFMSASLFGSAAPLAAPLSKITWISDGADNTTELQIYKNGVLNQTVTLSGVSGVMNITDIGLDPAGPDWLDLTYHAGTLPNRIQIWLS